MTAVAAALLLRLRSLRHPKKAAAGERRTRSKNAKIADSARFLREKGESEN